MVSVYRRSHLRGIGLLIAGLGGCIDETVNNEPNGEESSTTTSDGDYVSTTADRNSGTSTEPGTNRVVDLGNYVSLANTSVRVSNVAVQESFIYLDTPDSYAIEASEGTQYVIATVESSGANPPYPDELSVSAAGRNYRGNVNVVLSPVLQSRGYVYERGDSPGWVMFPLDNPISTEDATIIWQQDEVTVAWELPGSVVKALKSPPVHFEVRQFSAPKEVSKNEPFSVQLVVENLGDRDGVFRAAFNHTGPLYSPIPVRMALGPGERTTWTHGIDYHLDHDVSTMSFELRLPDRTIKRTVGIEE